MKLIETIILAKCLTRIESDDRIRHGKTCVNHDQCISKQCIPLCDNSTKKICIKPDWIYERHGLEFPQCVKDEHDFPGFSARQLGESCHVDSNCESKNCVSDCSGNKWRCIASKSFYRGKKIDTPKCLEEKASDILKKVTVSSATRHLGHICAGHGECLSDNCVPICESKQSELRCIEPRWSFEMYNMEIPSCVEREKSLKLEKHLKNSASDQVPESSNPKVMLEDRVQKKTRPALRKTKEASSVSEEKRVDASTLQHDIINDDKSEKTTLKKPKIDEEALVKLKKGEMKFYIEEPKSRKLEKGTFTGMSSFATETFTFLFGFQIIGFFFLILPFVLMLLL